MRSLQRDFFVCICLQRYLCTHSQLTEIPADACPVNAKKIPTGIFISPNRRYMERPSCFSFNARRSPEYLMIEQIERLTHFSKKETIRYLYNALILTTDLINKIPFQIPIFILGSLATKPISLLRSFFSVWLLVVFSLIFLFCT